MQNIESKEEKLNFAQDLDDMVGRYIRAYSLYLHNDGRFSFE